MDMFTIVWLISFVICFPASIIGLRTIQEVRVKDIIAMFLASVIPIFNVVMTLILCFPFFEKSLNKIVFSYKE